MNAILGSTIMGLSAAGFPLTQLVIGRFGRAGACASVAVAGGLLARDLALVATGTPGRLEPGPARLLWAETAAAAVATGAGLALLRDREVAAARAKGWNVPPAELLRRIAMGMLFGLHTMRFRIYQSAGSGLRRPRQLIGVD
jgi:hypothetical protein